MNASGQVYFLDSLNRLIMRIGADGKLETVLDGGQMSDGDAPYLLVTDIDFDATDNLILVDNFARVIRKLGADGVMSVVAGRGAAIVEGEAGVGAILNRPIGSGNSGGWFCLVR